MKSFIAAVIVCAPVLGPAAAAAAWVPHGNACVTETGHQQESRIAPDGAGGLYVVWHDYRGGADGVIYVQRLDSDGSPLFGAAGVRVCPVASHQRFPAVVSDGAGGVIVTWQDGRPGFNIDDIYAQRIGPTGALLWNSNGVALCTAGNLQHQPKAVSDGAGGAIVTWEDYRFGSNNSSIVARRVDAAGTPQWVTDGVGICTANGNQTGPLIVTDGAGGAIIAWDDFRPNGFGVYARRVSATGALMWVANGTPITLTGNLPALASDGAGGALIAWSDGRSATTLADIYVARYNATGTALWTAGGVAVCVEPSIQRDVAVVSDGAGGAVLAWADRRNGLDFDLYAGLVSPTGAVSGSGTPLCLEQNDQRWPALATDGAGGAIIAWADYRSHVSYSDIYASRFSGTGSILWTDAVSTAEFSQFFPRIVSDGAGGGFFGWDDNRTDAVTGMDVYAARYYGGGVADVPAPAAAATLELGRPSPTPTAGPVALELRLAAIADVVIEVLDASGRREAVRELRALPAGLHRIALDGRADGGRPLAPGVHFVRVRANGAQAVRRISVVR